MAENQNFESRTEAASPRRREQAEEEGQFAFSSDLSSAVVLLAGIAGLMFLARTVGGGLLTQVRFDLPRLFLANLTADNVQQILIEKFWQMASIAGMLLGVVFAALIAVNVGQAGFRIVPTKLAPDWERVSPFHFDRLFSWDKLMRTLLMLAKVAAVGGVAWWVLRGRQDEIASLSNVSLPAALSSGWGLAIRVALALGIALFILGAADYIYQRWKFERSLLMSREELKEERKREEGDPQMKVRRRRMQRDVARARTIKNVPTATVVVTNPTHLAVALHYEAGKMAAPKVVAKGADFLAKRIVALARQHGVPVVERKPLAQALFKLVKEGGDIPATLYLVVAELLALVYRMRHGEPAPTKEVSR